MADAASVEGNVGDTVCDTGDTPASLKSDMRRHVGFEMRKERRRQTARKQSADAVGLEPWTYRGIIIP